jgi:MFS family permease
MPIFVTAIDYANGGKLGFITAAYSLGVFVALTPSSWFSDKYGRKKTIFVGALLVITGGLVQAFTKGPWALMGGRLVVGLGSAFQTIGSPTLIAEIAHPRNRSQATALTQTCWYRK